MQLEEDTIYVKDVLRINKGITSILCHNKKGNSTLFEIMAKEKRDVIGCSRSRN